MVPVSQRRIGLDLTSESLEMLADLGMLDELAARVGLDPAEVDWTALGGGDD